MAASQRRVAHARLSCSCQPPSPSTSMLWLSSGRGRWVSPFPASHPWGAKDSTGKKCGIFAPRGLLKKFQSKS